MHRGGTSALAGMLQRLGVAFGTDLLGPQVENPLGFFEHRAVVQANDALLSVAGGWWCDPLPRFSPHGWRRLAHRSLAEATERLRAEFADAGLWGVKDPRLCRLMPLWRPVFARLETEPRVVIIVRHPLEVAESLGARNRMDAHNAQLLWLEHLLAAEADTRGLTRTFVTYEDLLADWRGVAQGIATDLGLTWPNPLEDAAVTRGVDAFLRPSMRHHLSRGQKALRPAEEVFERFRRLATTKPSPPGSNGAGVAVATAMIWSELDELRRRAADHTWRHTEENVQLRVERRRAQEILEAQATELEGLRAVVATVRAERTEAQRVLDAQALELKRLRADLAALRADRDDAQLIMQHLTAELARHRPPSPTVLATGAAASRLDRAD